MLPRLSFAPLSLEPRRGIALAGAALATACATASFPPPADVQARARAASSYTARLRVSLKAPELRARTPVLVAFRRPDALRVEVPGPAGARLVAVIQEGSLTAVFPGERAVFEGQATASDLSALLGVALTPPEVMDLLVGAPPARVRDYRARWGTSLPRQIEATLPDGGKLKVTVEAAEAGVQLPSAAFAPPSHDGYRPVDAREARGLWAAK